MNSPLRKAELLAGLTTRSFGRKLFVFAEIDSTNACARTLAEIGTPEGTTVIADYQSAGRGRLGRLWNSEPRSNLLFSVVLHAYPSFAAWQMTYLISESIARAVERTMHLHASVKWPNDLLVDGRKFCGILLEMAGTTEQPVCVGGVGVNVNQQIFPADLFSKATSLSLAAGRSVDRIQLFQAIMACLEEALDQARLDAGSDLMRAWMDRCTTFGRTVQVRGGGPNIDGTAIGLSNDGGLIVSHGSRTTTVYAGDVTISEPTA